MAKKDFEIMPKSRRKVRKQPTKKAVKQTIKWWTSFRVGFLILCSLATLLGGVAALVSFLPRITIEPRGSSDPSSSSPTLFDITNINIVPLEKIQVMLGVCYIQFDDSMRTVLDGSCSSYTPLGIIGWTHPELDKDQKYTIALDDAIRPEKPAPFKKADISIIVTYNPWFMPWRQQQEFKFFTKKQSDGKLYWFSK